MPVTWIDWRTAIFLGFSATQLPLGTWLDRHGPKKIILFLLTTKSHNVLKC